MAKKGNNAETERVVRFLKHFEGGRERIVKCTDGGGGADILAEDERSGGLGCASVRVKETDRREEEIPNT